MAVAADVAIAEIMLHKIFYMLIFPISLPEINLKTVIDFFFISFWILCQILKGNTKQQLCDCLEVYCKLGHPQVTVYRWRWIATATLLHIVWMRQRLKIMYVIFKNNSLGTQHYENMQRSDTVFLPFNLAIRLLICAFAPLQIVCHLIDVNRMNKTEYTAVSLQVMSDDTHQLVNLDFFSSVSFLGLSRLPGASKAF